MARDERILCVDIGGDSVKAAEFSHPKEGSVVLESFSFLENGLGDLSPDDPQYKVAVMETVKRLITSKGFTARNVYLSISGQNAFIRFVKVPSMTSDPAKIQKLLEFEAKQNIPFPEDEVVYGSQIVSVDDANAQVEAMFAIVKNSDVEDVIRNVEKVRKKVKDVELASTACYNASHFNGIGATQCEMLLNIGGRSSTLIFMDNGKFFVRTFLTAGHAITQQISKEFNISYADAEELKRRHGFVGLGGAYEEPASAVAATVSKIIRNVMTRLHGEIIRTINVYRANHGRKPERLYLTGGSSVMTYTPHFFSEKLRIPVEYFNPFQVVAVSPMIDKENLASVAHLFSEVVGLAMRGTVRCPVQISLMPEQRKRQEVLSRKIPYFYASCLALLFCVSVTYWSFMKQSSSAQELRSRSEMISKSTSAMMKKVQQSFGALNSVKDEHEKALGLLANRGRWMTIVNSIQLAAPDEVWFTSVTGTEAIDQSTASRSQQQPEDMGGFGGFRGFSGGGREGDSKQKANPGKVAWIVFRGHILTASSETDATKIYNEFKKRLEDCGLFEKFTIDDNDRMDRNFKLAGIGANVSTFTIEAKLKTPFDK